MSPTTSCGARQLSRRICQTVSLLAALVLDLDRVELQALGERVGRVDDSAAARCQRAEVEVVRSRGREADELAVVEHGHDEADVGLVRRAVVGVVVDDDVARLPGETELAEAAVDAGDVARGSAPTGAASTAPTRRADGPASSQSTQPKSSDSRMIDE